jgi:soluble lytic murein transglycosylase-like protein
VSFASAAGGIADVQARIAHIQARIATVSAPAPPAEGFAAALGAVPAKPEVGAGGGTPLPSRAPDVVTTPPAGPVSGASASGHAGVDVAGLGAWASKLPAAGQRFAGAIDQAAREAGIDPALLAALVRHESNFEPDVRSHAGAIGLAQLMPGTAAGLGVDPTDPLQNLQGGARYLREQLDRFGTPELALAAYNAGPNRVAQAGGIPRIAETQAYVPRVLATWEQLR